MNIVACLLSPMHLPGSAVVIFVHYNAESTQKPNELELFLFTEEETEAW